MVDLDSLSWGHFENMIYYVSLVCCSECRGVPNSCQDSSESTATVVALICHDCCAYPENNKTWIPGVPEGNPQICICQDNGN